MEASTEISGGEDGLWRLGILVEDTKLKSTFQDLRSSPMGLLVWFSPPHPRPLSDSAALAMSKLSLLNTFDNVHEYQAKKGVQLRAASTAHCRSPLVTLASFRCMDSGRETVLMNLDTESQSLERNTGLSRPTTPAILVASRSFLTSQGYSHLELVWTQLFSPLPLAGVILSGGPGSQTVPLTPAIVQQAMQQLSLLVDSETIILRQGTTFSLPGLFSLGGLEKRHVTVVFSVLECSPILQGRLTRETEIAVIPQEEGAEEEEEGEKGEVVVSSPLSMSQKNQSLSMSITSSSSEPYHDASIEESWESKRRSKFVLSSSSASDFSNEEEPPSDPRLEVATHPGIKLHRHYIIIPKVFATEHNLIQYETVLLVAEKARRGRSVGLADVVVSTRPRGEGQGQAEGSHAAVLMWYNGQSELERYLPPPYPGYLFEEEALQCAYVHPHLLYSLFHETLSPTRRYLISVKVSLKLRCKLALSLYVSFLCLLEPDWTGRYIDTSDIQNRLCGFTWCFFCHPHQQGVWLSSPRPRLSPWPQWARPSHFPN